MRERSIRKQFGILLLLVLAAMALLTHVGTRHAESEPQDWGYSRFLEELDKGRIAEATLEEGKLSGSTITKEKFNTVVPDDPELYRKLESKKVAYKVVRPDPRSPVWFQILAYVLIFGIMMFFLFFMRQAQGGGPGAMAFGKIRARPQAPRDSPVTFKDVAGVDEAKEELAEIVEFLKDPKKFTKLGGRIPKGVLLVGPPGTGKTLLARAVSGEAGRPFFSISGSDFVEMFVGVGAARVRDLFEQGKKNAPCIIFIDEVDAVGRARGAGLGGGHDEREQTLNQLLVEMDGFSPNAGVILIMATNRPDVLDNALLRPGRLDRRVVVDLPDIKGREQIMKLHSKKVVLAKEADLSMIARRTPGFSGADLANIINEAALLAGRRGRKAVNQEELDEAMERVMSGPERRSRVLSEREKKIVAYHESGHTLVAKLTPRTDPIHKVSIIPRGHALGVTMSIPLEDRFLATEPEMLAELMVLLGGRTAEETVFNEISTGAQNDLDRATAMARRMVCSYGMSRRIGSLTLGRGEGALFLGRDLVREKDYSEETAVAVDEEIRRLVEDAHKKVTDLLKKHRKQLEALAKVLLEKETVDGPEIDVILGLAHPAHGAKHGKSNGKKPVDGERAVSI